MPKAPQPPSWEILFSHSRPKHLYRCVSVSIGRRRIHLCTRCLALYPALALGLAARLAGAAQLLGEGVSILAAVVSIIGAALWSLEQGGLEVPKWLRAASGAMVGLGLGWVLGLHLREPWPPSLVELIAALALVAFIGVILMGYRAYWPKLTIAEPLTFDEGDEEKKTDRSPRNEVDPRAG